MHGITRVAIFCLLTLILPTILLVIPLYLRHSLYANVVYKVAESDIMEIDDGISTIFCSEHTLKMSTPFHAFKVSEQPKIASNKKHIRLKKSMILPDDTLEYWGFYLLKGANVALSVCSRFPGASILVVKGERNLRTCGMMEHNENKKKLKGNYLPTSEQQVEVKFQSNVFQPNDEKSNNTKEDGTNILNGGNLIEIENDGVVNSTDDQKVEIPKSLNDESSELTVVSKSKENEIKSLQESAMNYLQKHVINSNTTGGDAVERLRHVKRKLRKMMDEDVENNVETNTSLSERKKRVRELETQLNLREESTEDDEGEDEEVRYRERRNVNGIKPPVLLDRGIEHGGNAINFTNLNNGESSISSFENGLLTCYAGQVLLAQEFDPSDLCTNISFLVNSKRLQTEHRVTESGYYYYIFYSDNDIDSNDMHAVFDIYKPTFQYENQTESCLNKTECSFKIDFLSGDKVIVEVPTRDGIDHKEDDITLLTSTCHPRMAVYTIFPVAVLLLVLGCAFL